MVALFEWSLLLLVVQAFYQRLGALPEMALEMEAMVEFV